MTDKQSSMNVNKHVLTQDLNLRQVSNTAVFLRDRLFVLSPSAQNQHNWFDLSKSSVDRYQEKNYKGFLVIRFIREMMPADKYVINSSGRPHWKFRVKVSSGIHYVFNHQNSTKAYPVREFSVKQLQDLINK